MRSLQFWSAASVVAVAVSTCLAGPAYAATQTFNVPAQAASAGVRTFAKQAGIQIIVAGRDADGRRTNAVQGVLDVTVALDRLLDGTGLSVRSFSGNVAVVGLNDDVASTDNPIVVTGSRIARPELASPMPVSVVNMDESARLGRVTAYDALMREPAVAPGIGPSTSYGESWDGGISAVSLRNLGTNRSLTLIDGMRRVSGSARSSAVDINMIPPAMIERIEVITGGAAAIYGADAVTGAVNIITKRAPEGLNLSVMNGISRYGDAGQFALLASTGGKFAEDRGTFALGGTYSRTAEINPMQRPFARNLITYLGNPASDSAHDGIPDQFTAYDNRQVYYMYQPTYYLNGQSYVVDGGKPHAARPHDRVSTTGEFADGEGGEGRNLYDNDQLRGSFRNYAVIGRFDYQLNDAITYGARFDYGRSLYTGAVNYWRDDSRKRWFSGAGGSVAYLDNPFLPSAIRQVMVDNGLTALPISRAYSIFPMEQDKHDRESFTFFTNLAGKLAGKYNWEVYYQYGRTRDDVRATNLPYMPHWLAGRDVIADPTTGAPVCRDATARANGCVPFDIFSMSPVSQQQVAYLLRDRHEQRTNTQEIFGGSVTGSFLSLPYGDVSFALGAEHRRDTLKTTDDPLALNGELTYVGSDAPVHPELDKSIKVSEVYGELVVPLLRDLPFAHRLEIEGAYRYSDYSTVGATNTWKAGGTWSPIKDITLRGVRSRSVRTPNFGELYSPQSRSYAGFFDDPCSTGFYDQNPTRTANCKALGILSPLKRYSVDTVRTTGGNPDLQPETSNSLTLGAIFQPSFLPGFDMTVDYWDIDIKGVISQFSYLTVMKLCVDLPSIDNVFCRQVDRDANGHATAVRSFNINASRMYARGIDFGMRYRKAIGAGMFSAGFKGTWLIKQIVETTPGSAEGDVRYDGGYSDPRFRGTLFTAYDIDRASVAIDTRFFSAAKYDVNAASPESYDNQHIPARVYNDLSFRYKVTDGATLGLGINNIIDVKPPRVPGVYTGNAYYDNVGRYFHVDGQFKF
ncbi:TonB-dependent receptor [Sphingomonadaceae bacterium jetA1]|jgi:outer membrane receptor protein involved in Fe transport|uniref:TonB-dependent receptor domain-containing protein n=1 Tax=Facivitalis istanbulensis TaxID=3075838 RepID=UPI00346F784F